MCLWDVNMTSRGHGSTGVGWGVPIDAAPIMTCRLVSLSSLSMFSGWPLNPPWPSWLNSLSMPDEVGHTVTVLIVPVAVYA